MPSIHHKVADSKHKKYFFVKHPKLVWSFCGLFKMISNMQRLHTEKHILYKKRNFTCIFNASFLRTNIRFSKFSFMSKCRNVIKALNMNITTKAGKIKSTDQFDSRRGQHLKMQFWAAPKRPEFRSSEQPMWAFYFVDFHWTPFEPCHEKTCFCHMRATKAQISLRIRAVWSAPFLLAVWIVY